MSGIYDELNQLSKKPTPEVIASKEAAASTPRPPKKKARKPKRSTDRQYRSVLPIGNSDRPRTTRRKAQDTNSVLAIAGGDQPVEAKRVTERYAFEAYSDQKNRARDMIYRIEKKTGKRISISQILREAWDAHMDKLEVLLGDPPDRT
jgi:hypothetical protein